MERKRRRAKEGRNWRQREGRQEKEEKESEIEVVCDYKLLEFSHEIMEASFSCASR